MSIAKTMSITELREAAIAFQDRGEWGAQALAANEALLAADPADESAAVRMGRCLRATGRLDEAAACYVGVAAQDRGNTVARSQLRATITLRKSRQRAEAIDAEGAGALREALDAARDAGRDFGLQVEGRRLIAEREATPAAVCALGAAQRRGADPDGARNTYRWALELDDDPASNPAAFTGLAAVLRDGGQWGEAEDLLEQVLAVRPDDRFARLALAAVYMDVAERRGDQGRLELSRRLLKALWAQGARDDGVAAAFARLRSLGG